MPATGVGISLLDSLGSTAAATASLALARGLGNQGRVRWLNRGEANPGDSFWLDCRRTPVEVPGISFAGVIFAVVVRTRTYTFLPHIFQVPQEFAEPFIARDRWLLHVAWLRGDVAIVWLRVAKNETNVKF